MKSYFILDCPKLQKISDSLYGYYKGITANNQPKEFWTFCTREQIKNYFAIPNLELKNWFDSLGLKVRDMSFTVWNEEIQTVPHVDEPPVVAKINIIYYLIITLNILFALNPQNKNKLPISTHINPEQYISIKDLLKYEEIGYAINDPVEKSKFYFI